MTVSKVRDLRLYDGATWYQNFQVAITQVTTPSTVRRKKPLDLFASATNRRVYGTVAVTETPSIWTSGGYNIHNWAFFPVLNKPSSVNPYRTSGDLCDRKTILAIKDQKVNLSVSIIEMGKTTDMVANFARSSFEFLRSLRRGNLKGTLRALSDPRSRADRRVASKWLEFQYGWIPTMYEVHGLSELIYQRIMSEYITGKVRTFDRHTYTDTETAYSLLRRGQVDVWCKNHYRYKVDSAGLRTLSQSGITNPASVVWELIPYSFVIDWFVDIGDYLSSLDALTGVKDLMVIRSQRLVDTSDMEFFHPTSGGTLVKKAKGLYKYTRTDRYSPSTVLNYGYPRYEPALNVKRMVNGLALIRNLFK